MSEQRELIDILEKGSVFAARTLIGWKLYVAEANGDVTGGTIVETEAYHQEDAASHSYKGKTPRTEVMFGTAGNAYVYFTYGMHWCMNVVTGKDGEGQAVLFRAILPEIGFETMKKRRKGRPLNDLTNGPAKLCQALAVDGKDNGLRFNDGRLLLQKAELPKNYEVKCTKRIGISKDVYRLWRFVAVEK